MHLGAILFTAGSILGALAPNMLVMLVGRAIQGIGAGGVVVLGEIIITDLVPLNERGKWLGWLGSMWTIGGVIGPLTGGVFAQFATWRWVFWILIPFIIFGSIMLQFFLKQEPVAGHAFHKLLRVDWFGTVLFLVSTTAILVPLTCGGILAPWQDWRILVPILLGIDVLVIFIYWEKRHATEPMLRLTIFSNWTLRSTYIQTVLHAMIFWAMFYYLPLYYQVIKTYTPFQTGLAMLPQTLIVSPTTILIGLLISKTLRYRWSLYSGWLLTVLGTGLLILLDRATSPAVWIPINIVACLGIGALIVGMNFCVQAAVPAPDCGHAVAFYVFLRQFGEGLGVAVGGVIFQNRLRANLAASVYWQDRADEYARRATTLGEVLGGMQEGGRRDELVTAYVAALKMVWVAMCVVAVVGVAATGLVRGFGMQQRLQTEQGFIGDRRGGAGESGEAGSTV
jgi:predicted MFS family arabinose efflux permease